MDGPNFMSPRNLYSSLGTASRPLVSVRRTAAFEPYYRMLVPARRRSPLQGEIHNWTPSA
jgi:hypothetical protein